MLSPSKEVFHPTDHAHIGFDQILFHNLTCLLKQMILQRFRIATKGLGKFDPEGNELRIRKGSKLYRFACLESELRFTVTGKPEVVIPLADDATVDEFRRSIVLLMGGN